jgi:hypothetical protein
MFLDLVDSRPLFISRPASKSRIETLVCVCVVSVSVELFDTWAAGIAVEGR